MSVVWRKIWRDLWRNKFRTALVVLSTAVGVFAIGFIYGASDVMRARMTESHQASIPAHLVFYTGLFDQDVVDLIRHEPGVADAEGHAIALVRWKFEGENEWENGSVVGRADFEAQRINRFDLVDGSWPEGDTLAVERLSSRFYDIDTGTTVIFDLGRLGREMSIAGVARHPDAVAPPLDNAVFFAEPEMVALLADRPEGFNRLYVRLESFSEEGANEAGERLQDRLERMGVGVGLYAVIDPEVHPVQAIVDSVGLVLGILGGLSLALSGFLIVNMMNALVAQQIWQIGVMKVVGATKGRVVQIYLATALIYGLLSFFLAVLPAALAAHLLASVLLSLFNILTGPFRLTLTAISIQAGVGIAVPLLAALVPVLGGARITPHQAISSYGLGTDFGRGWLDRLVGQVRFLPRPLALSLRNTFRRKARIALTMITLVLGGAMFIGVMSVSSSMNNTLEVLLGELGFDVLVVHNRYYREAQLLDVAESVDGVAQAEIWDQRLASLLLEGGEEQEVILWGVPSDSELFVPRVIDGRAILPGEGRAILLNSKIATDEGIGVGDEITLTIDDRESIWTVVGVILNVNNLQRESYVPFDALARVTGTVNRGAIVMVQGEESDSVTQSRLLVELREAYTARRMEPAALQSADEARMANQAVFSTITILMLVMAVLAAAVGSVGLMSTMSVNVVERGREIGVMRAVGARSVTVLVIFVAEGVLVGVLSWLLAIPFSYPGALLLNNLVSTKLFQIPLDFDYSVPGVVIWLVVAVVLSAVASLWPALQATQVSVREALDYE